MRCECGVNFSRFPTFLVGSPGESCVAEKTKGQRDEESKRGRDKKTKSQRVKESKRRRDKERKSQREEESKAERGEGRKPFLCATAGRDLCHLTAQPCCGKIECAEGKAISSLVKTLLV